MRLDLCYRTRDEQQTISLRSDVSAAAAWSAAERLQEWASANGLAAVGKPFLRLHTVISAVVHLPVEGEATAGPGPVMVADRILAGPVIATRGVPFEAFRGIARNLQYEFGGSCRFAGPVEIWAEDEGFGTGTVVLPVEELPADRPEFIQVPT